MKKYYWYYKSSIAARKVIAGTKTLPADCSWLLDPVVEAVAEGAGVVDLCVVVAVAVVDAEVVEPLSTAANYHQRVI